MRLPRPARLLAHLALAPALVGAAGCAGPLNRGPTADAPVALAPAIDLLPPEYVPDLRATVRPPAGWAKQPAEASLNSTTQLWLSPGGETAFGVIAFWLPLPVGTDAVVPVYLGEMRRRDGRADVVSRTDDDALGAVRVVADSDTFRTRTTILVRGLRGWAVWAGTLQSRPVNEATLAAAEAARESVRLGDETADPADPVPDDPAPETASADDHSMTTDR